MSSESKRPSLLSTAMMGLFGAAVVFAAGSKAKGEESSAADHEKMRTAIEACFTETGVSKPEKPKKGEKPSEEEREKMEENRKKLEECMASKGLSMPKPPRGKGGGSQGGSSDESS